MGEGKKQLERKREGELTVAQLASEEIAAVSSF